MKDLWMLEWPNHSNWTLCSILNMQGSAERSESSGTRVQCQIHCIPGILSHVSLSSWCFHPHLKRWFHRQFKSHCFSSENNSTLWTTLLWQDSFLLSTPQTVCDVTMHKLLQWATARKTRPLSGIWFNWKLELVLDSHLYPNQIKRWNSKPIDNG